MSEIRILFYAPGQPPEVRSVPGEDRALLKALQDLVGGYIEAYKLLFANGQRKFSVIMDEDARVRDDTPKANRLVPLAGPGPARILGPFVIAPTIYDPENGETWGSLTDEEIEQLKLLVP